ncbi:WD40/YVTN/BNR-like repeat-containing protein [Micromonospora sp. NPDC007230]|uniref:WD40/YVTN/BNR-like repeat-containing protein n=1 Tax=Micromonospora sp. NPDC007230 TaxID=3364237 RepID=UPI003696A688
MSDREFSGFNIDTVADAVRQPPLDELRGVARSRWHRSVALAATALAALAAMAVAPLVSPPEQHEPAVPDRPSPGPTLFGNPGDFTLTGPASGVDVRIDGCVLRFARTDDGGRTWSDWDAARYQATRCKRGSTETAEKLEYSVLGDRSYLVDDGGLLRLSTDYGRTWHDADRAIAGVRAFPAAARPVFCQFGCGAMNEPLAVDPSTGKVYRLTGEPPSLLQLFSLYPAPDGTIWATYRAGGAATTGARSADRGATWKTWQPPDSTSLLALVGVDDREGYQLMSSRAGSTTLARTTDGGASWTATGADLPERPHWDLTVGTDGSLLAITQTGPEDSRSAEVLVSRDDGRSFTVARGKGWPVGSVSVAPGYAWLFGRYDGSNGEPDHFVLTRDGRTWTQFDLAL